MNSLSMSDVSWSEYTNILNKKSAAICNPLKANLELTPRCNFNCKMCYIHMSDKEISEKGQERTASEWINLGKQMAKAGTLEVLLTGGEVFIRPDFREIYEAYNEMGFVLHIYSNGYLINENTIEWLKKRPPMRIRISLYGASNETYEKVTGVPGAFDRVINNIDRIIAANIPLTLAATYINDNFSDKDAIIKIAEDRDLHFVSTSGVFKPVRGARSEAENVRIDINHLIRENSRSEKVYGSVQIDPDPFARCRSNHCGFWVTWDGKMTICSFIETPCSYPLVNGFNAAWLELQEKLGKLKKPAKCYDCKYAPFCTTCPGQMASETGFADQTNEFICEMAKAKYELFVNQQ